MRFCPKCSQDRPIGDFCRDSSRPDGLSCYCRLCRSAHVREWRKANPAEAARQSAEARDRHRAAHPEASARHAKSYRQRHPDRKRATQRRQDLRRYGLTPESFDAMLVAQAGRCACCGDELRTPHVDHDHETDVVRGLLCGWCNAMLGQAREDPARLLAGVAYLAAFAVTAN